ncbi:MAG: hypothetical protein LPJ89_03255 [Hymenobacteraceae bacterium]|nr:hypothetical protein [Hymenobacteraceae bacterium]MDX5397016.1 hypothetical protein [Hymenobacteraceae bacterium]MDX5442780.1 hypothetical protein [Hymenobacteraceae bacterium]MDX5513090.1 hypothetical protein [Hymenobacteraceae bacterium]
MANAHYTNITPEVFENLKHTLAQNGLELEGNSGQVSKLGVTADYNYNPQAHTLDIQNVKTGFMAKAAGFSPEKVLAKITDGVRSAGGQGGQV